MTPYSPQCLGQPPYWRTFYGRLGRSFRLILFDKRGIGLSDRGSSFPTAIAWTAPVLTSIRTPAWAQGSAEPCSPCAPLDCNNFQFCEQPCFSFCVERIYGHCFCSPAIGWNPVGGQPICASDQDCAFFARGSVCVQINPDCGAAGNVGCAAPCPGDKVGSKPGMKILRPSR